MTILHTSFHILDLDNDTVQRKEMPEEFQGFVKEYIEYNGWASPSNTEK